MNSEFQLPVDDVTITAWLVAAMRLTESRRPDACFNDEVAAKLLGDRETALIAQLHANQTANANFVAVTQTYIVCRTVLIDRMIERLVSENKVDTVLNIGAGLDTRPYRLNLPAQLHWYEADYAKTIEMKNDRLSAERPTCNLHRISANLADDLERSEIFKQVSGKKLLVLSEGLLPYLPQVAVENLCAELREVADCKYWMMDYADHSFMRLASPSARTENTKNVVLGFVPENLPDFLRRNQWAPSSEVSIYCCATDLKRLPSASLVNSAQLYETLKHCGVAVFEPQTLAKT